MIASLYWTLLMIFLIFILFRYEENVYRYINFRTHEIRHKMILRHTLSECKLTQINNRLEVKFILLYLISSSVLMLNS